MVIPSAAALTADPDREVFLRREAIAAGVDDETLRRAVRCGELVRVRVGAYVAGSTWNGTDEVGRHLLRARAVALTHHGTIAFSHWTAAALHGMDLWRVPLERVQATRLDGTSGRQLAELTYHQGSVPPDALVDVDRLPAVRAVRAALESATALPLPNALVIVDSGLNKGLFEVDDLAEQFARMSHWPDSLGLQMVLRLADGRHGSPGESLTGHVIFAGALPKPVPQYKVTGPDGFVAFLDFAWPELRVALEFDGRAKYEKHRRPGESVADAVVREKKREDRVRELTGWRIIRVTWVDLMNPAALVARIRRAMAAMATAA